jgi:hypothetical protein
MSRYGFADLPPLMSVMTGDEKHGPAATSTLDVLWVLYDRVLNVDPADPDAPGRDRFLLSKGHGPMAYYAVLAARGFIDPELLAGFGSHRSPLGHHPDRVLVPGAEISSGSLGHGLGLAAGTALGLRARGLTRPRVVVLLGDAELDEGSKRGDRVRGRDRPGQSARGGRRQCLGDTRLVRRHRDQVRPRGMVGPDRGRPRPRRARGRVHRAAPRTAARRHRRRRTQELNRALGRSSHGDDAGTLHCHHQPVA